MRSKLRHLPWLTFLGASLFGLSCSVFGTRSSLSLKVDPKIIGTRAPSRTAYDCYLVSISGSGISAVVAGNDIGSYAPDCLAPGVSSKLVSGTVLGSTGIKLIVPAGAKRRIRVLGVVTSLKSECENGALSKLFEGGRKPEIYELAAKDSDLFKDARIDFASTDVTATPSNLLNSCFPTTPPVFNPANLEYVHIVTRNNEPGKTLQNFRLSETGELTLIENVRLDEFPTEARPNRNLSQALYWRSASGFVNQITFAYPGVVVNGGTPVYSNPFFENHKLAYSDESKYVYVAASGENDLFQLKYDPELMANPPGTFELSTSFADYWIWGNQFHWIYDSGAGIFSYRAELPPDTFAFTGTPPGVDTQISIAGSTGARVALRGKSGLYITYKINGSGTYHLAYYAYNGTGFTLVGNPFPINEDNGPESIRLALDPAGKYLFVKFNFSGQDLLSSYLLDASTGAVISQSNLNLTVTGISDFAVDHRGKFLVYGGVFGGPSYLYTCPIGTDGNLLTCSPVPSGLALNLTGIQSIPIFR